MKIAFGNDHAAINIRNLIKKEVINLGHEVIDFGTEKSDSVDYPDFAQEVANAVISGKADRGILICGTGIGMCIAANRYQDIRCALCTDLYAAEYSRSHNNANILALRAREIDPEMNKKILKMWLETPFSEGERHQRRIDKLSEINKK